MGKHKAAALFTDVPGGPFRMDVIDFWGWEYEGGGIELLNEFYQQVLKMKIQAFPIFPTTAQSLGWFKKPIKSLADMKGLKYRVPGLAAEVYKEIGVSVVTLPGGEVLPAGERGVLDATEWYTPGEDIAIGLHNVWKFYHYPGMHETAGACDLLVNKDVWDKLAPDLQAIVRASAMQAAWRSLLQFNRRDAEALRDLQEKHKVTLVKTPDDVLVEYLKAWDKIAAAESAKDPFFKKVLDSQRAYAALVIPSRVFMNPYDLARKHYWVSKGGRPSPCRRCRGLREAPASFVLANRSSPHRPKGGRRRMETSPPRALTVITRLIDSIIGDWSGRIFCWLIVPLIAGLTYEVFARYLFRAPTIWAYDVAYMLYGSHFMLGAAYTLYKRGHIRTDFFFGNWSLRTQGWIDTVSYLLFFFPGMVCLFLFGLDEAGHSWSMLETSDASPWRPPLYPFKTVIPITGALLFLQGVSEFLKSTYAALTGRAL
jgi:TRAP-type mannitol/chloroaromatic compound transport system permease small subunit